MSDGLFLWTLNFQSASEPWRVRLLFDLSFLIVLIVKSLSTPVRPVTILVPFGENHKNKGFNQEMLSKNDVPAQAENGA